MRDVAALERYNSTMSSPAGMSSGDPLGEKGAPNDTAENPPRPAPKKAKGGKAKGCLGLVIGGILFVVILGAILGGEESTSPAPDEPTPAASKKKASKAVKQAFRANDASVVSLLEDKLGDDPEFGNSRVRESNCNRITCTVQYNADTPVFSPEKELLNDMRPVFKKLFSDKKLKEAKLVPYGETTSVGGKKSVNPIMRISCDRAADDQIDWDNVDYKGVKALCDYTALVNFD